MIIHNFAQRTPEWYAVRLGRFTGSDFHTMLGKSEARNRILLEKTAERLTGRPADKNDFINADMQRGIEKEGEALLLYELHTGNDVQTVGFVELDEYTGCSPDGLVGDDGMIEIKCPKDSVFVAQIISGKIKPEYVTQIQFNLYVTGRQWCDYIAYNENFDLHIKRFFRDEEKIEEIKAALACCICAVQENITKFEGEKS